MKTLPPSHDRVLLGGCPGYVRGWCCKARDRSLHRGYRDVGYLVASNLRRFRPEHIARRSWVVKVGRLRRLLRTADEAAALKWFTVNYPRLMALIPVGEHADFVAGVRERRA